MPALPRSSLVGLPPDGPPPGRGEARLNAWEPLVPRAEGPMDARALGGLPLPTGDGLGPGLGLDGGRSDAIDWTVVGVLWVVWVVV